MASPARTPSPTRLGCVKSHTPPMPSAHMTAEDGQEHGDERIHAENVQRQLLCGAFLGIDFSEWAAHDRELCAKALSSASGHPPAWNSTMRARVDALLRMAILRQAPLDCVFDAFNDLFNFLSQNQNVNDVSEMIANFVATSNNAITQVEKSQPWLSTCPEIESKIEAENSDDSQKVIVGEIYSFIRSLIDYMVLAGQIYTSEAELAVIAEILTKMPQRLPWFPRSLVSANFSASVLGRAGYHSQEALSRLDSRRTLLIWHNASSAFVASENVEGYAHLYCTLASITDEPVPEFAFFTSRLCTNSNTSHEALVIVWERARSIWKKINCFVGLHRISLVRVADAILHSLISNVKTHWPVYLCLLQCANLNNYGTLFIRIMQDKIASMGVTKTQPGLKSNTDSFLGGDDDDLNAAAAALEAFDFDASIILEQTTSVDTLHYLLAKDKKSKIEPPPSEEQVAWSKMYHSMEGAFNTVNFENLFLSAALLVSHGFISKDLLIDVMNINECLEYKPALLTIEEFQGIQKEEINVFDLEGLKSASNDALDDEFCEKTASLHLEAPETATSSSFKPGYDYTGSCAVASFVEALLKIGEVKQAFEVFQSLPQCDWCLVFPRIATQLLIILEFIIDPSSDSTENVYYFNSNGFEKNENFAPFLISHPEIQKFDIALAKKIVDFLGEMLHFSPKAVSLLAGFCRSLPDCFDSESQNQSKADNSGWSKVDLLLKKLIPAQCIMHAPPQYVANSIWACIEKWPAARRYALYHASHSEFIHAKENSLLKRSLDIATRAVRYWMKRASKETQRQLGRRLVKLCSGSALVVLECVVAVIMSYENLTTTVVEALSSLDKMSNDILLYTVIKALDASGTAGRRTMKVDGQNLESWVINLSQFLSSWLFANPKFDFTPLICYMDSNMFNEMHAQILSDLISKLTGIGCIVDVPVHMLLALESRDSVALFAASPRHATLYTSPTKNLVRRLTKSSRKLNLLHRLRKLYLGIGMQGDWEDFGFIEKVTPDDLLNAVQWRDLIKSIVIQYLVFLKLFCNHKIKFTDYSPVPINQLPPYIIELSSDRQQQQQRPQLTERTDLLESKASSEGEDCSEQKCEEDEEEKAKADMNMEKQRRMLFWKLRLYDLVCDSELYLSMAKDRSCDYDSTNILNELKVHRARVEKVKRRIESAVGEHPSLQDLYLRAMGCDADAYFVCEWLRMPCHAEVAKEMRPRLVSTVWAASGCTKSEAAQIGIILRECLSNDPIGLQLHLTQSAPTTFTPSVSENVQNRDFQDTVFEFMTHALKPKNSPDSCLLRNALQILKALDGVFPKNSDQCAKISKLLEPLQTDPMLCVMVRVVLGKLKQSFASGTKRPSEHESKKLAGPAKHSRTQETGN